MGVENVVVTLGSEGSAIFKDGDVVLVPAKKVKAEDTTAAGDTFCAGICVGLSEGKSLEEAVEFATAAAAITVTRMGAQSSIPFRSEL
jgi:ribokinase